MGGGARPQALRWCWLYPLRDLMGFGFWLCSFFGRTIVWRGDRYRLEADGLMVPAYGKAGHMSEAVVYGGTFLAPEIEPSLVAEQ